LPPDERVGWLEVDLTRSQSQPVHFNTLVLFEPIGRWDDYPQTRIGHYRFMALVGEGWIEVVEMTSESNGGTREVHMHRIPRMSATRMRLEIRGKETEPEPHVAELGIYNEPG
jgi:alpha-L-fucosidase